MKLQVNIDSAGKDAWKATVTVLDGEDFPTTKIFQNDRDFPGSQEYALVPGTSNSVSNLFLSSDIAERWAKRQIHYLQGYLKEWRRPTQMQSRICYI